MDRFLLRSPRRLALLALACLLPAAVAAVAAEPVQVASVEGITEYKLDNGVRVLLFPDDSRPTVTVNMTVLVGSRHEGYGETGMAHLLEHMVFKGTPTHASIPKLLQERGAQFNGTTWTDRTNYYETLPAAGDNLEFALRLEADRLMNSFIKREDLASEMSVVRSEFERGENDPFRVLHQRMMSSAYEWHNYGKSTIGNRSDIERVPIENLQAFYRKFYRPDNVVLVVAGKFDPAQALKLVQKYFGGLKNPSTPLPNTYTEEPAQDGERQVTVRRVGNVGVVGVAYHIPAGPHDDFAALSVLDEILTAEPAGKLYKALVQTKKASSVGGMGFPWHDPGLYMVFAEVRDAATLDDVRSELQTITESVGKEGVTAEDVNRAKQRLLSARELAASDTQQIAVELSQWAAQGDWRLYLLHRDRLEAVTPADVQRVAAAYLRPNNRTAGIFIPTNQPDRVEVPATPDVAALIKDYKGREAIAQGEQFDSSPENIDARTKTIALGSGLKIAFLPKKNRGESVTLYLRLHYGNADNLKGLTEAGEFLPSLMVRGTKQLEYQQLQDELSRNRIDLSASSELGGAIFQLETKQEFLPKALDLLKQIVREPALRADELEVLRQEQLASLEQGLSEPSSLAPVDTQRRMFPYPAGDVRYIPTLPEQVSRAKEVTLEQIAKLHRDYLNGQHGELVLVGDFDPDVVAKWAAATFEGWSAKQPYERVKRQAFPQVAGGTETVNTPDKANAMYFAGFSFPLQDTDPQYPALVMGNYVLGSGTLSSRLGDRVRQKEGLSYGVRSNLSVSELDPRAAWIIYAIMNPKNADRTAEVILEEVTLLADKGMTEEELGRAQQGYLEQQRVARSSDNTLSSQLADNLFLGRTMAFEADLEKKIRALTTKQVDEATKKFLVPSRLVITIAGDLKKQ